MALKDILVHVDNTKACEERINVALRLAQKHGATVTGLYIAAHAEIPRFMEAHLGEDILQRQQQASRAAAKEAEDLFTAKVSDMQVPAEWRQAQAALSDIADTIAMYARHTDVTILGQHDPKSEDLTSVSGVPDKVILTAGAPVLIVPYAGRFPTIGEKIMVAWKPYRESVRALNDAMVFMETSQSTMLLCANPGKDKRDYVSVPGVDIQAHLKRHSINVSAEYPAASDLPIGDLILSRAADIGADMIVCGAYGRPRLRELVLGGVTQHLLSHMTVPVLMSH